MNDPLTIPARDGIEAQRGLNDIFPGDPYPVRDQLKRGLDEIRAKASRGKITSTDVFTLTDPLMDILARCEAPSAQRPFALDDLSALRKEVMEVLGPFVFFARNVDDEGWTSNIHRESISTWLGPSDFRAARTLADKLGGVDG